MLNMWQISWRSITRNKKRFIFSLIGIIIGISFVTSMLIADKTTNDVFNYYEQMYVANADYWVLSDEHTYAEEDVTQVINNSNVEETLLALDKQAFFELEDKTLNQRSVRITGVNDQNSSLLKLPVTEGELDNDGLIISEDVANLLNKNVGDVLSFTGMGKAKISAVVEYTQLLASPTSWESAESTSFRIMAPLPMLREWTGMDNELSYVRFQTDENGETLNRSLQEEFSQSNLYIQPVVADDLQDNDIDGLYTLFYLIAILSMFISGFIVFNLIYTSVMERKKEFAIMKSLGYLQRSVSKLIFIEVLLIASIGTAIGVPVGIWLGDMFMQALLNVFKFDMVYQLNWKIPVLTAGIIGIIFPILFSLFPIYNAGKTSVLLALKMSSDGNTSKKQTNVRSIIGIGLLLFIFIDHPVSYLAFLASVILLFPLLLQVISFLLKPIFNLIFGYPGNLATHNLTKQLNRNANTSAILAIGIGVILLLSAIIESAPEGYETEIRNTYGGDVRMTSETPWSNEDRENLLSYDHVDDVEPLREAAPITWKTIDQELKQFSVLGVSQEGPALFEASKNEKLYEEVRHERTILLGQRAFDEWGGDVGDYLTMNTPSGEQQLQVIDVVDTSHYSGYVAFMDEERLDEEFGWSNHFDLLLTVNGEQNDEDFRGQLWNDFGSHLSKVQTVEDEIKSTTSALLGANDLIVMMLLFIIGLASIGTTNTLLMNILERTDELGTMRALGLTKQQVIIMVLGEGLLIGFSGVFGGIVSGLILLYMASTSTLLGDFISFQLPFNHMIIALIAGLLLSLMASWISSMTASKINILSSLKEG